MKKHRFYVAVGDNGGVTITITKEDARAYCRSIGMKFFEKKWQDKTVIISI